MAGWAASIPQGQRGNASLGDLAVLPDGRAYAYSGNDDVPTFLGSRRVKLGEWHNLAIVAGFATHTSRFYGDDHLLATFA